MGATSCLTSGECGRDALDAALEQMPMQSMHCEIKLSSLEHLLPKVMETRMDWGSQCGATL